MSKKETQATEEKQEKVVTKYDLKMQRRAEEKKKVQREKLWGTIGSIVIVAAVFALVISFPIRNYLTVNGTYITVAGQKVTPVEYDYHFNLVKTNYNAQYSYYLSMFGIDLSGDLTKQMYSDTLTWQDYFDKMTVEDIANTKALTAKADEAGFAFDADAEYAKFQESIANAAKEAGMGEKEYLAACYGTYATEDRIKPFVMETLKSEKYYASVAEAKAPSEEELKAYYEENRNTYDSVDYRMTTIDAVLPTEPTDLADPVEETEGTEEGTEEKAYEPSEAEIEFAMKVAQAEANNAVKELDQAELTENAGSTSMNSDVSAWLFDESRKSGDTTVIENTSANCYYCVKFERRYLDETPSADARIIFLTEGDAQAIYDEWTNGETSEDRFAALADQYTDEQYASAEGGLFTGLLPGDVPDAVKDWLFDTSRKAGDTTVVTGEEDQLSYVLYYVGANDPEWKLTVKNILVEEAMTAYIQEIGAAYKEVSDPKGNLNYLKVEASEAAAAASESESSEASEESSAE